MTAVCVVLVRHRERLAKIARRRVINHCSGAQCANNTRTMAPESNYFQFFCAPIGGFARCIAERVDM